MGLCRGFEPEAIYQVAVVFWVIIIILIILAGAFSQRLYLYFKDVNFLKLSRLNGIHDIIFFQIGGISLVVFLFSRIIYASNVTVESCSSIYLLFFLPAIQIILALMLVYVGLSIYIHLGVSLAKDKITSICYWTISIISILVLILFMKLELDGRLIL